MLFFWGYKINNLFCRKEIAVLNAAIRSFLVKNRWDGGQRLQQISLGWRPTAATNFVGIAPQRWRDRSKTFIFSWNGTFFKRNNLIMRMISLGWRPTAATTSVGWRHKGGVTSFACFPYQYLPHSFTVCMIAFIFSNETELGMEWSEEKI